MYSPVKMYTDCDPQNHDDHIRAGDYVITGGKRATAAYFVQTARESPRTPGRIRWTGIRFPRADIPAGANTQVLHWYSRDKK